MASIEAVASTSSGSAHTTTASVASVISCWSPQSQAALDMAVANWYGYYLPVLAAESAFAAAAYDQHPQRLPTKRRKVEGQATMSTNTVEFKLGEEFIEKMSSGVETKSTAVADGDRLVISCDTAGIEEERTWSFNDAGELVQVSLNLYFVSL